MYIRPDRVAAVSERELFREAADFVETLDTRPIRAEADVEEDGLKRDEMDWTPEASRRARGFAVYAAIRSLGRAGIAELLEGCCANARRFAATLEDVDRSAAAVLAAAGVPA